jgi:hypothetical protein
MVPIDSQPASEEFGTAHSGCFVTYVLPLPWLGFEIGITKHLKRMAHPARFELTTSAFGGQRSIQLSYGCRQAGDTASQEQMQGACERPVGAVSLKSALLAARFG